MERTEKIKIFNRTVFEEKLEERVNSFIKRMKKEHPSFKVIGIAYAGLNMEASILVHYSYEESKQDDK